MGIVLIPMVLYVNVQTQEDTVYSPPLLYGWLGSCISCFIYSTSVSLAKYCGHTYNEEHSTGGLGLYNYHTAVLVELQYWKEGCNVYGCGSATEFPGSLSGLFLYFSTMWTPRIFPVLFQHERTPCACVCLVFNLDSGGRDILCRYISWLVVSGNVSQCSDFVSPES